MGHKQFKNDEKGFVTFLKLLSKESLVIMEATGYYHYRLAQFLYKKGVIVSVVNPLSVKRFIQMKLAKVKTDKSAKNGHSIPLAAEKIEHSNNHC